MTGVASGDARSQANHYEVGERPGFTQSCQLGAH